MVLWNMINLIFDILNRASFYVEIEMTFIYSKLGWLQKCTKRQL